MNQRAQQLVNFVTDESESTDADMSKRTIATFAKDEEEKMEYEQTKAPSSAPKRKSQPKTSNKKVKEQSVLETLLSERKDTLKSLDAQALELNTEIRILEKVLAQITSGKQSKLPIKTKKKSPGRPLAIKWQQVLQYIHEQGDVSFEDIMGFIEEKGLAITRSNLRVQLNSYIKREWIAGDSENGYKLTELSLEKISLS